MNSIVIPFFDITVSINTLLGLALLLLIFFTFFSVSFKLNVGEGDDTNLACNRRRPEETDGDGASKASWLSGLGFDESSGDNDDPVLNAKSGDEDSSFWF
jgi:hypothetical protein